MFGWYRQNGDLRLSIRYSTHKFSECWRCARFHHAVWISALGLCGHADLRPLRLWPRIVSGLTHQTLSTAASTS